VAAVRGSACGGCMGREGPVRAGGSTASSVVAADGGRGCAAGGVVGACRGVSAGDGVS